MLMDFLFFGTFSGNKDFFKLVSKIEELKIGIEIKEKEITVQILKLIVANKDLSETSLLEYIILTNLNSTPSLLN